jgi:hypothetical protein
VLIFVLGVAGAYSFRLVGSFPGCELLVLFFLPPLLLLHPRRAFRREYRWFYILLGLWLLGTVLGDVFLGVPAANRLKGIARVVFLGLDYMTLAILINRKPNRMVAFALSIAACMIRYFFQFQGDFITKWKFGGSTATTIVALLISCHFFKHRRYAICLAISGALAALNLVFAFRSQVGLDLVSGVLILPLIATDSRRAMQRPGRVIEAARLVFAVALLGAVGFLANKAILYAAAHDLFDEGIKEKFEIQASGKLGVLAGGRPETLVAIQAIRDSPIIGHGSFAVDPKYYELEQVISYENGYQDSDAVPDLEDPGIPTHSHLTLAWVESGILGGVFWIYALFLILNGILALARERPPLTPLYLYLLLNFVWDVLYSPMGSANRIWNAYLIMMCYDVVRAHKTSLAARRTGQNQHAEAQLAGSRRQPTARIFLSRRISKRELLS